MITPLLIGIALHLSVDAPEGCVGRPHTGNHAAHAHYTGFERGPLKLELPLGGLGWCWKLSSFDEQGRDRLDLLITSSGGEFLYEVPTNEISGRIRTLRLRGYFAPDAPAIGQQPARLKYVRILPDSFTAEIITTKALETTLYGGKVLIPAGSRVSVTNSDTIVIMGETKLPQRGVFTLATAGRVTWRKPSFSIQPLPDPIQLELASRPGTKTNVRMSLGDAVSRLHSASFYLSSPNQFRGREFVLRHPRYGARVTNFGADSVIVDVLDTIATLRLRKLQFALEFASKEPSRSLPVLARGHVTAGLIAGTAGVARVSMQVAPTVTAFTFKSSSSQQTPAPRRPRERVGAGPPMLSEIPGMPPPSASAFVVTPFQEDALHVLGLVGPTARQDAAVDAARANLASQSGAMAPNLLVSLPYQELRPFIRKAVQDSMKSMVLADTLGRQLLLLLSEVPLQMGLPRSSRMILSIAPHIQGDSILEFRIASGLTQFGDVDVPNSTDPVLWAEERAKEVAKAPNMDDVGVYKRRIPKSFTRKAALKHDWKDVTKNAVLHLQSDEVEATTDFQNSVLLLDNEGVHLLTHMRTTWKRVP